MRPRSRSIATLTLAALIAVLLTACGGPGTTVPDDDSEQIGEDEGPYWETVVASGADEPFTVTGTSVAFAAPNVVLLSTSDPAGWSVRFTITGDLPIGIPYITDNEDLLNATVGTPTGNDCVATSETNFALPSSVTLGQADGDVPVGIGTIFVEGGCGTFTDETTFTVGFGVQ